MSDVFLFQTLNDGDVEFENGDLVLDDGLRTAAYLSLFGGNIEDAGYDKIRNEWWANLNETDTALQYRSETQNLLQVVPLTSNNLLRIEDAAKRDLQWLVDKDHARAIDEVVASVPAVNTLKLVIYIDELKFEFVEKMNGVANN